MTIFDRFRRSQPVQAAPTHLVRRALLPQVNQRVTVLRTGHPPVPSRVEDEAAGRVVIAAPTAALHGGEHVVISWEGDDGWYSLESTVGEIHDDAHVPTVSIIPDGRISHHDDRRLDDRWPVELPISLRPVMARVAKQGITLQTTTTEISGKAVRFTTSAPFAPGDMIETRIELSESEFVTARIKVIRVDSAADSWRQVCTATFDEILRSDRSKLMAFIEAASANGASTWSDEPSVPMPAALADVQMNMDSPDVAARAGIPGIGSTRIDLHGWNPPSDS